MYLNNIVYTKQQTSSHKKCTDLEFNDANN